MYDENNMNELLHSLINKTLIVQSIIKLLEKSDLDDKQAQMISNSNQAIVEVLNTAKLIREKARK